VHGEWGGLVRERQPEYTLTDGEPELHPVLLRQPGDLYRGAR
jgi:hypothetical protein